MNYFEYSLICLVLVLIVGITWLYYDLAAMTSRKEQWRFIALEREEMTKRLKKVFNEAKIETEIEEAREG